MKKLTYDDIIDRVSFFRTRANLSLRELSAILGYNEQFMKTIENKSVELKVKTLIDFCDATHITLQDFFYLGEGFNKDDKNILDLYNNLSYENKQKIIDMIKGLQ